MVSRAQRKGRSRKRSQRAGRSRRRSQILKNRSRRRSQVSRKRVKRRNRSRIMVKRMSGGGSGGAEQPQPQPDSVADRLKDDRMLGNVTLIKTGINNHYTLQHEDTDITKAFDDLPGKYEFKPPGYPKWLLMTPTPEGWRCMLPMKKSIKSITGSIQLDGGPDFKGGF